MERGGWGLLFRSRTVPLHDKKEMKDGDNKLLSTPIANPTSEYIISYKCDSV